MAMSVTKFFRKYNKQLLAILVIGLMIVFLLPASIRQIFSPNPLKSIVGYAYNEPIRLYDRNKVELELQILTTLNSASHSEDQKGDHEHLPFNWPFLLQYSDDPVLDYYLLIKEAEKTGITILDEQVDQQIFARGISPQYVNAILEGLNIPLKTLREAVRHFLMVENTFGFALSSVKVSEPQLRSVFAQTNQKLELFILPISSSLFISQIDKIDEKELVSYFANNQERFRFPNRVAIEYVAADLDKIASKISISRLRARQYWQEHKSEFVLPQPDSRPTDTDKEAKPHTKTETKAQQTTQPKSKDPSKSNSKIMDFEEAYPKIVEKLKYIRARNLALTALSELRRISLSYWRNAPKDPKTELPKRPDKVSDYARLAKELSEKYNIELEYQKTDLLSKEELFLKYQSIANAFIIERGRPLPLYEYAFRVVPFITPPPPQHRDRFSFLVPWQDSSGILRSINPATGKDTIYLIFRITEIAPSRLPKSLNEVKEKVIEDYKEYKAYKLALNYAEKLTILAEKEPLNTLGQKDPIAKKIIATISAKASNDNNNEDSSKDNTAELKPITFSRLTWDWSGNLTAPYVPGVLDPSSFVKECFDIFWKTNSPDEESSSADKIPTAIIKDDKNRICYLVQLKKRHFPKEEDYKRLKPFIYNIISHVEQLELSRIWLSPDNIRRRTQFQPAIRQ